MKKLLVLAACAGMLFTTACGDDNENGPTKVLPTSWTAKLLGAQRNNAGSFFSPTTGAVYVTGDSAGFVNNKVDITFANLSQTGTPTFLAPAARRGAGLTRVVTVNRNTLFSLTTLTKAQFDTVSNGFVAAQAGASASQGVEQGKVYSFLNAENKSGLIYVSNVNASTNFDGAVTIDVKFEK